MKTLKANNYEQAKKELKSLDDSLVGKLKDDIQYKERGYFHIVLVKILDRPGQVKNEVQTNVQVFHKIGFEKLEKNFRSQGFNKIIILHDPRQLSDSDKPSKRPATKAKAKTEDELRAEIRKELEAEYAAKQSESKTREQIKAEEKAKMEAEQKGEDKGENNEPKKITDEVDEIGQEVLSNGTVEDLDAFAKDYGVKDYPVDKNKPEKQKFIENWLKS